MRRLHWIFWLTILNGLIAMPLAGPSVARERIEKGDIVITQESPRARKAQRNKTAGAAIFVLKPSGQVETLAEPPAVTGPRGIRADRDGTFVFADAIGAAIGRLTREGRVKWLHKGSPLTQPKDVAIDLDGNYVIADFPNFDRRTGAQILKLTRSGKISTVYRGAPLIWPHGIAVDKNGDYIIADHDCCIYRLTPKGEITLVAKVESMITPQDVKIDGDGSYIVTDMKTVLDKSGRIDPGLSRHPTELLRVSPSGEIEVVARKARSRFRAVALASDGGYLVVDMNDAVYHFRPGSGLATLHSGPPLSQPAGIAVAE